VFVVELFGEPGPEVAARQHRDQRVDRVFVLRDVCLPV
jgi:hypothetical protein